MDRMGSLICRGMLHVFKYRHVPMTCRPKPEICIEVSIYQMIDGGIDIVVQRLVLVPYLEVPP